MELIHLIIQIYLNAVEESADSEGYISGNACVALNDTTANALGIHDHSLHNWVQNLIFILPKFNPFAVSKKIDAINPTVPQFAVSNALSLAANNSGGNIRFK